MRRTDNKLLVLIALMVGLVLVVFSCSNPEDPADTQAPTVTLTSPTDAAVVPNTVDVVAEATDNEAVAKVEFYIDAQLYATDDKAPWACVWTLALGDDGQHTVFAKAYDAAGNTDNSDLATVTCENNPPAAISDFAATEPDIDGNLTLTWTAPGDDGTTGTAAVYDIRYYWYEVTLDGWSSATELTDEPVPQAAGSDESFDVTGLNRSRTYYFAIRTQDAFGNWSDVSNNVEVTTRSLFGAPVSIDVVENGTMLVGCDFDDDSDVDLAVSHLSATENLSILLNNGNGTYATPVVYDVDYPLAYGAAYSASALVPTDMDNDGDLDLAITCGGKNWQVGTDSVSTSDVMFNDGAGLFESPDLNTYDSGWIWCQNVVWDPVEEKNVCAYYDPTVHEDNSPLNIYLQLDLLVVDSIWHPYYADDNPSCVREGDINGDGIVDLAVSNRGSTNISILFGNGDGTYQAPVDYGTGYANPSSICIADFNGDGLNDVANTNYTPRMLTVFRNLGGGVLTPTPTNYDVDNGLNAIFAADLDGDNDMDLVAANTSGYAVNALFNNGDGTFDRRITTLLAGRDACDVKVADITGDGTLDIVVANHEDDNVSVIVNEGEFAFYSLNTVTFAVGDGPRSLYLDDVDGDGDVDIVVLNDISNTISILFNCIVE